MNAIDEGSPVTGYSFRFVQVAQLLKQGIAQFVIGVKRENPFALNLGKAEIALTGEAVERPLKQRYLRIAREDIECPIRAAAVRNDDAPCPGELVERASD